jgi:hypothetical protein
LKGWGFRRWKYRSLSFAAGFFAVLFSSFRVPARRGGVDSGKY